MKQRILFILKYYLFFVAVFVFQKPVFMLYHHKPEVGIGDALAVIWSGLAMDMTTAGYMTILPLLFVWIAMWVRGGWINKLLRIYSGTILSLIVLILVSDIILFEYWGSHIDNTALFYLRSPVDAAASVSYGLIFAEIFMVTLISIILSILLRKFVFKHSVSSLSNLNKVKQSIGFLLLTVVLAITIRGGIGVSTMNVGRAYFSGNMFLNQSAINPAFNLFYSLTHQDKEDIHYNFMNDKEANVAFNTLKEDSTDTEFPHLLNTTRPNIILIVLESFSAKIIAPLGGLPDVTPNINRLSNEGIFFTNFKANSFRTDRGLISLLSGTPSLPTTPLMKFPSKLNHLPSISGSLKQQGYDLSMLYGGDINFANMRQYFVCSGFENIASEENFSITDRLTKWGAPDHITFPYLFKSICNQQKQPFMKMFLTLSSHEPFDVPTRKFNEPYLNATHYTDSCLGHFIDQLKKLPVWKNTLVILIPDHSVLFPKTMQNQDPERYQIPMLWLGGAIRQPMKIDTLAAQSDLAATLLAQMDVSAKVFTFSRNFLKKSTPKCAFFSYIYGFGFLSKDNAFVYDCGANQTILKKGLNASENEKKGKAYIQTLLKDFNER
ncbi:MAG: sulfatase-like hydrolase/transferase [Bacteroidales bacterium]|nr:sulfatase-like hydrolase/transferase [Bacteroidales bacterium]